MKRPTRLFSAFTLIELLVVIAIISILAAILFPVFARARENARRASCLSNLKQIGLGVMMYVQDYDESYPQFNNYTTNQTWQVTIQPYVKNKQVFYCPSSSATNQVNGNYGANMWIFLDSRDTPNSVNMAALESASTGYMLMDFGTYYGSFFNARDTSATNWNYLPGMGLDGANSYCQTTNISTMNRQDDCQSGRHFRGINMAFADGHVKWLKSEVVVKTAKTTYNYVASPWNPAGLGPQD